MSRILSGFVFAAAVVAAPAIAQTTLASRVAQSRDGVVRLEYAARPGVCGNGRDMVAYRHAMFARSFESWGTWSGVSCVPGPMRVTVSVSRGTPTQVRTQVGGAWPVTEEHVTDLGIVLSRDAAAYFLSLVPALEHESGRDRLLLPAVLAADAPIIEPLLALARDHDRTDRTRRQAIQWLGLADDGAGVTALLELSSDPSSEIRRETVFWLGQTGDPRAIRRLHQVIEDKSEETRVRSHAIFSLANGDHADAKEFQYLRSIYPRLDDDHLREAVFQAMAQDDAGGTWLTQRARDASETIDVRKKALFWAGQRGETHTADLVAVYREAHESSLREHAIFVLSQREDDAATDALIRIAREDDDRQMRSKALFWLAQKHDPRVVKLIADILVK